MDDSVRAALFRSQIIDLTTTGRRTGQRRRIEIFLHEKDGMLFISEMPRADRARDWIYKCRDSPALTGSQSPQPTRGAQFGGHARSPVRH